MPATLTANTTAKISTNSLTTVPDSKGRFGQFGGRFVPETLMFALDQLDRAYREAKVDPAFQEEYRRLLIEYVGRPSRLYYADRLTKHAGGAKILLKREDLNHTGAHKINNALGQAMVAKRMGKKRIIAETGAGMHGVATATAAALFGLECRVYMGIEDIRRQELNVFRMRAMGAEVYPVESGSKTLKDATNEAMREWMSTVEQTHYIIGSVVGPHPFPMMVRDFQRCIGVETRQQCIDQFGKLPNSVVACVGGGSNAAGMFHPFVSDESVELVGVEAGGHGPIAGGHASTLSYGSPGVLHGSFSYVLQDHDGQTENVHSVSAGLDYPGVGPEHSFWKDAGRVKYRNVTDDDALDTFHLCGRLEGILPALETAHAVHEALKVASEKRKDDIVVVCFSGRGDKDCAEVARVMAAKNNSHK
jgi:tryptophan synthase beta chain